jgi:Domain of unknown function (DUF4399)
MRQIGSIVVTAIVAAVLMGTQLAQAGEPSPAGAKVFFVNIKDGDTVTSPVTIKFGLTGMNLAPAGDQTPNTGHHHLIIDDSVAGEALNQPIPADAHHVHFGKAQTEATVTLEKGPHTLQLVLGDWTHIPHNPPVMSDKIKVTVE